MKSIKKICAIILSLLLVLSLAGCGATEESSEDRFEKLGLNIQETPSQILEDSFEEYEDPSGNFTALVPEGWEVSTGGFDMYYWIRIFDPEDDTLQVYTLLKAETLLADQASKDFYEQYRGYELYTMFADAPVAGSVAEFYDNFIGYTSFAEEYEPTYRDFEFPAFGNFYVIDSYSYDTLMSDVCFDNALLHGGFCNYHHDMAGGEGLFTGSMCQGIDLGQTRINSMYNVNAVTAQYGKLSEYVEALVKILESIEYSDDFVSTCLKDQQIKAAGNNAINQTLQETSDIIINGWYDRQSTYDIESEKYSDTTLGYERVYDIETGEVYRAYNGFSDVPGMDEYFKPITDDMYSDPIVGYIEK